MSVYRTKGERISMKKFKIKTNLVSGILMGAIALLLLVLMPGQVRVPAFDSGAPSPRIIPGICLGIMLASSIALLIQSLVLKQEKVIEFDWAKEKPAILLILGMCVYIGLMLCIGYVLASLIVFIAVLFYVAKLFRDFRHWEINPAIMDYCFSLFAMIAFMLASYHAGAFSFERGARRRLAFYSLLGVLFGAISLAGAQLPELLIYAGSVFWMLACAQQMLKKSG